MEIIWDRSHSKPLLHFVMPIYSLAWQIHLSPYPQSRHIVPLLVSVKKPVYSHWQWLNTVQILSTGWHQSLFKNSLMLSTCLQRNTHVSKVQSESPFPISCPSLEAPQLQKNILHDFKHTVGLLGHYLKLNKEFSTYFRYTLPIFYH